MVTSGIYDQSSNRLTEGKSPWHAWFKAASSVASIGGFLVTLAVVPSVHWGLWVNDELLTHKLQIEGLKAQQAHSEQLDAAVRTALGDIRMQIEQKHVDLVQRLVRVETALEKK